MGPNSDIGPLGFRGRLGVISRTAAIREVVVFMPCKKACSDDQESAGFPRGVPTGALRLMGWTDGRNAQTCRLLHRVPTGVRPPPNPRLSCQCRCVFAPSVDVSAADHTALNAPTVPRQHSPTNHAAIVVVNSLDTTCKARAKLAAVHRTLKPSSPPLYELHTTLWPTGPFSRLFSPDTTVGWRQKFHSLGMFPPSVAGG